MRERRALFGGAIRDPQRFVEPLRLPLGEARGGVRVADPAAKAHERTVLALEERAAAVGTPEAQRLRRVARPRLVGARVAGCDLVFDRNGRRDGGRDVPVNALRDEANEEGAERVDGHDVIRLDRLERGPRHARHERVVGRLDDAHAARRLHGEETRRAIIQVARQDDADDARPERARGAAKERIDRGARAVLRRSARQEHVPLAKKEMMIGARGVDPARLDRLAVLRLARRKRRPAAQHDRQNARGPRRHVHDDE